MDAMLRLGKIAERLTVACQSPNGPLNGQVEVDEYEAVLKRLIDAGVEVGRHGDVKLTIAATELFARGPWQSDITKEELQDFAPRTTLPLSG